MARKSVEPEDVDYTVYRDKEPTDLQERFGAWLLDKLELEFGTKKEEAAFLDGVRISTALRMKFQASPENQEVLEERRGATAAEKPKPKPKLKRGKVAKAEEEEPEEVEEEEPEEVEEEAPKPRRSAKSRTKTSAAAGKTTRRKAAATSDAPF